jgi:hypothetical protein
MALTPEQHQAGGSAHLQAAGVGQKAKPKPKKAVRIIARGGGGAEQDATAREANQLLGMMNR